MATTTDIGRVRERSTGTVTAVLEDEAGDPVPAASLTSLTLTVYDVATNTILNDREDQDVLNDNDVTVDGAGQITWNVQPADTALVTANKALERHRAVFEASWDSGTKRDWHAIEWLVESESAV